MVLTALRSPMVTHPVMRVLTVATLVNTLGNGLFLTTSALFFTRSAGLSASEVGLGLAIGGVCGIVSGVPLGHLADRVGARRLVVVLLTAEAVAILGYAGVHSFAAFVPVVCVVSFLDRGAGAVRNGLIATVLSPEERVTGRSFLRAMTNVGIGAGAALAAIAIALDSRPAYLTVIAVNAVTFLVAGLLLLRLPETTAPAGAETAAGGRRPLTDLPYLLITLLSGLLTLQAGIFEVGLPLWTVHSTHAPRVIVSVAFVLNTVLVVLFQVRAGRGVHDPASAARACVWSGVAMAASCAVFAAAKGPGAVVAAVLILVGLVVQTVGEMTSAAGTWALSYDLADPRANGAYQGVFNSGFAAGILLGPLVVTSTALRYGPTGWLALGALFLLTGLAVPPATRWARAQRLV